MTLTLSFASWFIGAIEGPFDLDGLIIFIEYSGSRINVLIVYLSRPTPGVIMIMWDVVSEYFLAFFWSPFPGLSVNKTSFVKSAGRRWNLTAVVVLLLGGCIYSIIAYIINLWLLRLVGLLKLL